ncbi:MAG: hypothetical protein QW412_01070 [Candidatus Aenigmatarchaeota archaeon]
MGKNLFLILFFLTFLPNLAFAASFSINPIYGNAGTNIRLNFSFSSEGYFQSIKVYVPPCNKSGCENLPYYNIDKNSVYSLPNANITFEYYEGIISAINFTWNNFKNNVFFSFKTKLDTPPQNRIDKWVCFYKTFGNERNISTLFYVLAPNLEIVELKIEPKEVNLNLDTPQVTIYINTTVKNVKDLNHSGTSYDLNPLMLIYPDFLPPPSSFSVNSSLSELPPNQALLIKWNLSANYYETKSGLYRIKINVSDKNNYYSLSEDYVNISKSCTKCYVKIKECPSQVYNNSKFQITYEINTTSKHEIQAVWVNETLKECFKENYDECLLKTITRTISAPSTPGMYELKVSCYASDYEEASSCGFQDSFDVCKINVTSQTIPRLFLSFQTDKKEYVKGEKISISGSVKNQEGNYIQNAEVYITLESDIWKFEYKTYTNTYGNFYYQYPISFGDPEGTWTISVKAFDAYGNTDEAQKLVEVKSPPETYYSLAFLSPTQDSTYKRGETLIIEVNLTKANKPESGASVTCKLPNGLTIKLNEKSQGIYSRSYNISFDDSLGTWSLVCQGIKEEMGKIYTGGSFINIIIEPTKIELNLISPQKTNFTLGETVIFIVEAYYPNGEHVKGATVKLTFQGETVFLAETQEGNYTTQFEIKQEGKFIARILAEDASGNEGEMEKTFMVESNSVSILSSYWWLSLFLPLIFPFIYLFLKRKFSEELKIEKEIKNYKKELEHIEEMQKATQQEYFHRKIEEEAFKRMMEDFEKKTVEVQVRIKELEAKLEELKSKK